MIKNPKIGQEVWFFEPWAEDIHSAKITALGETEVLPETRRSIHTQIYIGMTAETAAVC